MDIAHLRKWIGRTQTVTDVATSAPVAGLAALLDHDVSPWRTGELPPLAHWLYFLPHARQSEIDVDGHPRRGDFMPPISLPRRMWAGSRLAFHRPIELGEEMTRQSTIVDVAERRGTNGTMIFVTIRHEISAAGMQSISEEQDVVFRELSGVAPAVRSATVSDESRPGDACTRRVTLDPTQLFRFSALTFNAHRIHYDRDYCTQVEGYPGLVVQGPLTAMLLMDHFLQNHPQAWPTHFDFRATHPLFEGQPFDLSFVQDFTGAEMEVRGSGGERAMIARVDASR